jgi:Resolvase, N terminal domain
MSADEQIEHLTTVAHDRGWTIVQAFIDRPATVKKDRRLAEMALGGAIRSGAVDKVLISGIDRVGRSLTDLVTFMEVCRTAGVSLWLDDQRLGYRRVEWLATVQRDRDDGPPPPPNPARQNSARSGGGSELVHKVRTPAHRHGQDGKGQARIGCRQGRATGRQIGRYVGGIGQPTEELDGGGVGDCLTDFPPTVFGRSPASMSIAPTV